MDASGCGLRLQGGEAKPVQVKTPLPGTKLSGQLAVSTASIGCKNMLLRKGSSGGVTALPTVDEAQTGHDFGFRRTCVS